MRMSLLSKALRPNLRNHSLLPHRALSTVDSNEVRKFAAIGASWWDPASKHGAGPLHSMNPVRVGYIRTSIASSHSEKIASTTSTRPLAGLRILDAGCGGGLLSEALARLGGSVTGIDPSAENISVAKAHAALDPATSETIYLATTVEEIAKEDDKFDVVCSLEVIEHVDETGLFLRACTGCLREGGSLFLSTINKTPQSLAIAVVGAEYVTGIVPPGTHDWRKFIAPDDLEMMVKNSCPGMELVSAKGLVMRPQKPSSITQIPTLISSFLKRPTSLMTWELSNDNLDINYIMHFVKRTTPSNMDDVASAKQSIQEELK